LRVLIVGAGKLGYDLTKILSQEEGLDIIVVDTDAANLRPIADSFDVMTIQGNGASVRILQELGIKSFDIILAVTENDELNMISCMAAKKLGVLKTAARVRNPEYNINIPSLFSYSNLGIDLFINPEFLAAQEMFRLVEIPLATEIEYFADGKLCMIGIKIDENLAIAGKKIYQLNLDHYTIVAVNHKGKIIIPDGDTSLLAGDKIYVFGKATGLYNLNGLIKQKRPNVKRIIIAGGSWTSQYLVKLIKTRKSVPTIEIIEASADKCRLLSKEFEGCQLICADATKIEVLEEENVRFGDVFIATTGSDNSNLVACMLAYKLGVREIICEISREDYASLADTVGVTATITPRLLTVSTVLKLFRQNVISLSLVDTGEAEALEFEAEADSPITKAQLKDLVMPGGVVIGSVLHAETVIVPRGETLIETGDRVIVFALHGVAATVERLFRKEDSSTSGAATDAL
jgi:trk system potassium uptake protein TrkA